MTQLSQATDLPPQLVRQPVRGRVGVRIVQRDAAGEEEVPLRTVHLPLSLHELDSEEEGEEELILSEEREEEEIKVRKQEA